jgi:hypothetical protein
MAKKKMIKVKLWCCTHDTQSMEEDVIEVDADTTDEELDEMAKEYMYNTKEPEWGFKRL